MSGDISYTIDADVSGVVNGFSEATDAANEAMSGVEDAAKRAGESFDRDLGSGAEAAKSHIESVNAEALNLGETLKSIQGQFTTAFEASGLLAAYEAAEKLTDSFAEVAESAAIVAKQSEILGLTTDQYQALSTAATLTDTSFQAVFRASSQLEKQLDEAVKGNGKARETMMALGLSAAQAADPHTTLNDVLIALNKTLNSGGLSEEAIRTVRDNLSRQTLAAIPAFKEYKGSIEDVAEANAKANALQRGQIDALEDANRAYKATKESASGFYAQLLADAVGFFEKRKELAEDEKKVEEMNSPAGRAAEHKRAMADIAAATQAAAAEEQAANLKTAITQLQADETALTFLKGASADRVALAQKIAQETAAIYDGAAGAESEETKKASAQAAEAASQYSEKFIADQKKMSDATAEATEKETVARLNSASKILAAQESLKQISPESYSAAQIAVDEQIEQAEIKLYTAKKQNLIDDGKNNASNAAERMTLNAQIVTAQIELVDRINSTHQRETEDLKKALIEQEKARVDSSKIAETIAIDQATMQQKAAENTQAQGKGVNNPMDAANKQIEAIGAVLSAQQKFDAEQQAGYDRLYAAGAMDAKEYAEKTAALANTEATQAEKAALQIQQIQLKSSNQVGNDWKQAMTPIATGFASTFDGMLKHTETFQQGMQKIASSILSEWEKSMITVPLEQWAQRMGRETALAQASATEKMAIDKESSAQSLMMSAENALKERANSAANAAANAYKSAAAIPYVGWILGPVEAAAAFAAVMAFPIASAAGGMVVDEDQMAMVHENEMILPADISQGINEKILMKDQPSAENGGTMNHFNVSAMDSKSFEKFLSTQKNRNSVANMVSKANQRGNRNVRQKT